MKPVLELERASVTSAPAAAVPLAPARSRVGDFIELTKPRIGVLVLATTAVGFVAGCAGPIDFALMFHTIVGTALAAAGANALNQLMERDFDALMHRTANRPIPSGRIAPVEALCFGLLTSAASIFYLALLATPLAAAVAAATLASYLLLYTPLKRRTPWCTAVGAIPGALPPVIGWAAARGSIGLGALLLFAIVFVWQIPHFWAIAWIYRDDYRRASFPMLAVIDSDGRRTGRQVIWLCSLLLAVSTLPWWLGVSGAWYFGGAILLGLLFLASGVKFATAISNATARRLMLVSIAYLPLLLGLMIMDR
jgi:protoheme IX farnesyltransferase